MCEKSRASAPWQEEEGIGDICLRVWGEVLTWAKMKYSKRATGRHYPRLDSMREIDGAIEHVRLKQHKE